MTGERQPDRQVRIRVRGRVQRVGFRATARAEGQRLGLDVRPRNLDDGSVEIEAGGATDALARLITWAGIGPPAARVDAIDVEDL